MPKILISIQDEDARAIKKKAASLGLTTSAYIRQVLKDSLRKQSRPDSQAVALAVRRLIPVLVQALGRTQNASSQATEKLKQILLKEYDQGGS